LLMPNANSVQLVLITKHIALGNTALLLHINLVRHGAQPIGTKATVVRNSQESLMVMLLMVLQNKEMLSTVHFPLLTQLKLNH
jgi:hypothetical protein